MQLKAKLLIAITFFLSESAFAQNAERKTVIIEKTKIAYKYFRPETNRKANDPIVVFESGVGGGSFEQILEFLPKNIKGIEYDRNGLGESEIDTTIKTDIQVVDRLHKLLTALEIEPPYLLVGHSLGGPFIRLFASKYPSEVCGLVFIDPTDFMLTKKENDFAKKATSSLTGYREIWTINMKAMSSDTSMPKGIRSETKRELAASTPTYFKEYQQLPPLKDIPITVVISYNKPIEPYESDMNKKLKLGINILPWWKEFDNFRIKHYTDLIRNNHNSKLILLPGYSHGIHYQDPSLVATEISDIFTKCLNSDKK